ncbi:MAG: DUF4232 domain-containing protein [Planctomycetaceae bacterium]
MTASSIGGNTSLPAQAGVIPWIPTPAARPTAQPVPAGAQPCDAQELSISIPEMQGETGGQMAGSLTYRNVGNETCTLRGYPHVSLLDADGEPLPVQEIHDVPHFSPDRPRPPTWPFLVLRPRDEAFSFVMSSNWCRQPVARWRVVLPGGSAATLRHGWTMGYCVFDPGGSRLFVDGFEPPLQKERWPLAPTIRDTPTLSAAGSTLDYVVTLTNVPKHPFEFSPDCPSYVQRLVQHHHVIEKRRFVLNCAALGGPIPGGAAASFAMQMPLPPGATGEAALVWVLDPPYGFSIRLPVTI